MLNKFISSLTMIKDQDALTLGQQLNGGHAIIVADKIAGPVLLTKMGIKYLFRVEGNRLLAYKLNESTDSKLVLTLCAVYPMTPDCFKMVFDAYISQKTCMYTCDDSMLDSAELKAAIPGGPASVPLTNEVRKAIDQQMGNDPKSILFLETPYA